MKFYDLRAELVPPTRVRVVRAWGKVGGEPQTVETFVDVSGAPALLARYELRRAARGYAVAHESRAGDVARAIRWTAPSGPRVRSAPNAPQLGLFIEEPEGETPPCV